MNWLRRPASDTQITHGQRLWLYALAVIIMFLLVQKLVVKSIAVGAVKG